MHQAKEPPLLKLDTVGDGVKVYVKPVLQDYARAFENIISNQVAICFHLVKCDGSLFHKSDLDAMCLNPNDISELLGLCSRRVIAMTEMYLPKSKHAALFLPQTPSIDANGFVHVSFLLSRYIEK